MRESAESTLSERIDSLVKRIVAHYRPRKIILFGSAARGDYVDTSDVDLIVVAESDKTFTQRLAESAGIIPDPHVDLLIYTPQEFEQMLAEGRRFLTRALAEGKVLYESQG